MTTTKAKKKRSAAEAVLGEKGSASSLVLGSHASSAVTPDKEVKSKPVRAGVKKIVSIRKSSVAHKTPEAKERFHKSYAGQGVFFAMGSFCGKIKQIGLKGWEKI